MICDNNYINLRAAIDANRGDPQNGWDTDQFPTDLYQATEAMMIVLQAGGFVHGGLNFDAKVRRTSFTEGDGLRFSQGQLTLAELAKLAESHEDLPLISGKQELIENIINQYL
jgi:xylose isomerase